VERDWIAWSGYPKFWAQLVRTSSMRRKVYDSYDLSATIDDGRARWWSTPSTPAISSSTRSTPRCR
jgi:hypothetical protein